jgi:hypothetical protein
MKMFPLFCTALLAGWLSTACTTSEPEVDPVPSGPEKGYATGKVVDTQGKPLADVEIVVNNTQFYNSNIVGRTDSKGEYKLQLTPGSWYVRGTVKVQYDSRTYVLDLHPETDGAFAGTEGAVRNLRWKLTGAKPTEFGATGYYGGLVEVYGDNIFDTDQVELTLEPVGKLIDGSTGQKIVRRLEGGSIGDTDDIPMGRYRITARHLSKGKAVKVRVRNEGEYGDEVTTSFEPAYEGATGRYKITLEARLPQ